MASVDNHELAQLAADLRLAPGRMERDGKRIVKRGALEVKKRMQKEFSGHRYGGKLPGSLEFQEVAPLTYDIGELDSAGPSWGIAAIMAFGTSNNAPNVDHTKALTGEADAISDNLGDKGESNILGAGGGT